MLKIQVDLQEEYKTLVCARSDAAPRRKTNEGQYCFVQQDIERPQHNEDKIKN